MLLLPRQWNLFPILNIQKCNNLSPACLLFVVFFKKKWMLFLVTKQSVGICIHSENGNKENSFRWCLLMHYEL